jgi:hypothetical protein
MHYPTSISWRIDLAAITSPDQLMSRERSHRLAKALALLSAAGYTMQRDQVDETFLSLFIPLYEEHMRSKKHGRILDVRDRLSASMGRGRVYESISLWQGSELRGAQIYGLRHHSVSVAHRVFPWLSDGWWSGRWRWAKLRLCTDEIATCMAGMRPLAWRNTN